jgi:hypothetical protein
LSCDTRYIHPYSIAVLVDSLIKELSSNWKDSIEKINKNIMQNFPDFKTGSDILGALLSQFVRQYGRFEDITKKYGKVSSKDITPSSVITYEIKKYMRTFE